MEEFLKFVIGQLVDYPDEVVIARTDTDNRIAFRVVMRQTDLGKIIGKGGHTIHAIRNLLNASAEKHGKKVTLHIVE
ncbi:MAG: KH domain-containing protein [Chthoniobacterales bacterium]